MGIKTRQEAHEDLLLKCILVVRMMQVNKVATGVYQIGPKDFAVFQRTIDEVFTAFRHDTVFLDKLKQNYREH